MVTTWPDVYVAVLVEAPVDHPIRFGVADGAVIVGIVIESTVHDVPCAVPLYVLGIVHTVNVFDVSVYVVPSYVKLVLLFL